MIHRDIRYRRFQRRNAIQHKVKIAASSFSFSPEYLANPRHVGQWAKGKVHCSCPLCACKSTEYFGVHDKSMHNYSASDRRKFMSMQEQITEYYTAV